MKKLIIIGASAVGREVLWAVQRINNVIPTWDVVGFVDDNKALVGKHIADKPVLGGCERLSEYSDSWFICAINSPKARRSVVKKVREMIPEARFAKIVDPSVILADSVQVGEGTIVYVNSFASVDAVIGRHNIINYNCTVGHDVVLDDFVSLNPAVNIAGCVHVGCETEVGTGVQIIQGRNVGEGSVIGAGAVVVRDIPDNCTAVGVPARVIKTFK